MTGVIPYSINKKKKSSLFYAYSFFIMPIIDKLCIGSIAFSQITLLVILLFAFFTHRVSFSRVNKELVIVLVLISLQSIFSYFSTSNSAVLHRWFASVFYFVALFIYPSLVDADSFYKAYKRVSILVIFGLVYHLICIYVLHIPVNPLTLFPSLLGHTAFDIDRPMSFFSEPSHLAVFLFPLLFIATLYQDKKWIIITLCSLFLSTSFLGILMAAIIMVSSVFSGKKRGNRLLYIFLILITVYVVIHLPIFDFIFDRGEMIMNEEDGSATARTLWGIELIKQLDTKYLLWGIGAGNQEAFFKVEGEGIFYNSLFGMVIDYGFIIAIVTFFLLFFSLPCGQSRQMKYYILLIFILISTSSVYFTSNFFFIYVIFFLFANKNEVKWYKFAK